MLNYGILIPRASNSGNTASEILENCASNLADASRMLLNEENMTEIQLVHI